MPLSRLAEQLDAAVEELVRAGTAKGAESVITEVLPARGDHGPRVRLDGQRNREFLRMSSNSYLGLSRRPELIEASEQAARRFGVGPGAVRFISGTSTAHLELERALARFHGRPAAMATSSAYTAVMGVLFALSTPETAIISDELNHNCIVNGARLARPMSRAIYAHLDLRDLEKRLSEAAIAGATSALVITDGVFSMRGDHAPLRRIAELVAAHDARFPRNAALIVDDSHGVFAYGERGRGTEEVAGAQADVLVGTLGKALGVNGGYIAAPANLIRYLREKNPFTIYSNPISPPEAAAATRAIELADSAEGRRLLRALTEVTARFRDGLARIGWETVPGFHPVVPVLVRDTARLKRLTAFLRERGILVVGLDWPVVPHGQQLVRFQLNAEHTAADVDLALQALDDFRRGEMKP